MKALSIREPWASLIVDGVKPIENRTWSTRYRGPLLIHAGGLRAAEEWDDAMDLYDDIEPLPRGERISRRARVLNNLKYGGVIGVVDLLDCVKSHESPWFFGPFGFVLANPRRLKFRPLKGRLGLFNAPEAA